MEETAHQKALREALQEIEDEKSFASQFGQGLESSASLGYEGTEAPQDLPLTGKIGRIAGELTGAAPVFSVLPEIGAAAGLGKVASEAVGGGLYGLIRNPNDQESRFGNAMRDAALFGVTGAVFGALGRRAEKSLGEMAGEAAPEINPENISTPEDLQNALVPLGRGFSLGESSESAAPFRPRRQLESDVNIGGKQLTPYESDLFQPGQTAIGQDLNLSGKQLTPGEEILHGEVVSPEWYQENVLKNPEILTKAVETTAYDQMINPWASQMAKNEPAEAKLVKYLGTQVAEPGNVSNAALKMTEESGLANLGEAPKIPEPQGGLDARHAIQTELDGLVDKNNLTVGDLKQATMVQEPVNFLMSKGVNFEDASKITDDMIERAEAPLQPITPPEMPLVETPKYEDLKTRALDPEEVNDMFFNTPIKAPQAFKHGLLVTNPEGQIKMTPKGYDFLRQYNPDFNVPLSQPLFEGSDRKWIGAIRGRGYSNLDFTEQELRANGMKMPLEKAVKADILRPGKPTIDGEPTFQLTAKGAAQQAGGRGFNADINLKAYDIAQGARLAPGETEGIARLAAESQRRELLFKDVWAEINDVASKGCPE